MTAVLDAPATAPRATAPTGTLAELILVRLLPGSKSVSPKVILKTLTPFFKSPPTEAQLAETLTALRKAEFVAPRGQLLTEAGRKRALDFLGILELPAKMKWQKICDTYLLSRVLGVPVEELKKPETVAALLLKRKLNLPVGTGNTLSAVFDAFACQLLGFRDRTKLDLRAALLSQHLKSSEVLTTKQLVKIFPAALLAPTSSGKFSVKSQALLGWADEDKPTPPVVCSPPLQQADETFDLADFAATVRSESRRCPTGWFGDNKVFISHVWRQLRDEPRFQRLGLEGFKTKLVEANRAAFLTLSRADLVQVMNPDDIRESETAYLNATFHFILTDPE